MFQLINRQGRSQEFERGGGGGVQFKAVSFPPKVKQRAKKVNTSADVQFSARSQVKSKKRSSRLQIVLYSYISPLHDESFEFCASSRRGGGGGGGAPPQRLPPLDMPLIDIG